MKLTFCTNCGAILDADIKTCKKCGVTSNLFKEGLSEVTVKELGNGETLFYRPLNDETNFNSLSPEATKPTDNYSKTSFRLPENPVFDKLSGLIDPYKDNVDYLSLTNFKSDNVFTEDLFIDPIEYLADIYPVGSDVVTNDSFYNFSDSSDVLESDAKPALFETNVLSEEVKVFIAEDTLEDSKAPLTHEIFDNEFKPIRQEPLGKKIISTTIEDESYEEWKNKPISAGGWIGIILLLMIPAVNILLLIIWACGGCRKRAKASFARAALLVILIFAAILAVVWFAFGNNIIGAIREALILDGTPSAIALSIIKAIQNVLNFFGMDLIITPSIII